MDEVVRAVALGLLVMLAGTIPRNIAFAANLQLAPGVPWAVPVMALYLWFFWRYLDGAGPPRPTATARAESLRANRVTARVWAWSLAAGGLGIVTLVIALRLLNRVVHLPPQQLPDLSHVPRTTVFALLLTAAPIAGMPLRTPSNAPVILLWTSCPASGKSRPITQSALPPQLATEYAASVSPASIPTR